MYSGTDLSQGPGDVVQLWFHENCRVYQDRLVSDKDRLWFHQLLETNVLKEFRIQPRDVLPQEEELLFGDFMNKGADVKLYQRILSPAKVTTVVSCSDNVVITVYLNTQQFSELEYTSIQLSALNNFVY